MDELDVSLANRFLAKIVFSFPGIWKFLGDRETATLSDRLTKSPITEPVYVTGLARSGTTLLLQILASHPDVATHRYRDFPFIFTPYWWSEVLKLSHKTTGVPVERAHNDGVMVTPDSPEAMEEPIWMAFFDHLHKSDIDNRLDESTDGGAFPKFYRDHLSKLLLAQGKIRYVSKGNYNVTRILYIKSILPDARFVIPIRHPIAHIGSLIRQHRGFLKAHKAYPAGRDQMRQAGHFEFGLDFTPINVGIDDGADALMKSENRLDNIRGWARYWSRIYQHISEILTTDTALADKSLIVRFEDLCDKPDEIINKTVKHCHLDGAEKIVSQFSGKIKAPTYYNPGFTEEEIGVILYETETVRKVFGY